MTTTTATTTTDGDITEGLQRIINNKKFLNFLDMYEDEYYFVEYTPLYNYCKKNKLEYQEYFNKILIEVNKANDTAFRPIFIKPKQKQIILKKKDNKPALF